MSSSMKGGPQNDSVTVARLKAEINAGRPRTRPVPETMHQACMTAAHATAIGPEDGPMIAAVHRIRNKSLPAT